MAAGNRQPLQSRSFDEHEDYNHIPIQIDEDDGGYENDEFDGGGETMMDDVKDIHSNSENSGEQSIVLASRTSELTVSFEGEVYVFHAVTPEKVHAVLLLLGGLEIPSAVPTVDVPFHQNDRGVGGTQRRSNHPRRIASVVKFREKRKERSFDKKVRYNSRKEAAQCRVHRKNGQFASLRENNDEGSPASSIKGPSQSYPQDDSTPRPEIVERKCQHCGIGEKSTPAMRRGPAGPGSLCNACGLMWANKGTLRHLTKSGRNISFDQNEPETPGDTKALTMEAENLSAKEEQDMQETLGSKNPSVDQDEQGSLEDMKHLPLEFGSHSPCPLEQETLEDLTRPSPVGVENPSVDLDEQSSLESSLVAHSLWGDSRVPSSNFWDLQGIPNDLAHVSRAKLDIPANPINEQNGVNDSDMDSNGQGLI